MSGAFRTGAARFIRWLEEPDNFETAALALLIVVLCAVAVLSIAQRYGW